MTETEMVLIYGVVGCMLAGVFVAMLRKRPSSFDYMPQGIAYVAIPLFWPLFIPSIFIWGISKLVYYVLYSKAERVEKVTKIIKS